MDFKWLSLQRLRQYTKNVRKTLNVNIYKPYFLLHKLKCSILSRAILIGKITTHKFFFSEGKGIFLVA